MKKRTKIYEPEKIENNNQLDNTLLKIADLKLKIEEINAEANREINEVKEKTKERVIEYENKIKMLEVLITNYCEYNKNEIFRRRKSLELNFGSVGYRKSTRISVKRDTLELLKEMGFHEAVRVKEQVNKDVLKEWDEERLKLVHAKKKTDEGFWYEVKIDEIISNERERVLS